MCGGCGGSHRAQNVRKQTVTGVGVQKALTKKQPMLKHIERSTIRANKVEVQRQYIIPRQTCPKCGYPAMVVNIANRERYQCSNSNCRQIIR
jgi:ssDNA-binding Zn-finger/Zn-ribbon topoisomerase 1